MKQLTFAEYIWLDGAQPTQGLRSKTRVLPFVAAQDATLDVFPQWGYDGSSTNQASGNDSDLLLEPVAFVPDPIRGEEGHYLVLCEVLNGDGQPHETNHRARLRELLAAGGAAHEPWFGFEQEYTLYQNNSPLGFPERGYPAPQGPYYCGIGANAAFGRPIAEQHLKACAGAGIMIYGINAEVMPGQWEFQIGHRGLPGEHAGALEASDHLWIARWLLERIAEEHGIWVSWSCKPMQGDWNGAGMHTNFSTVGTRDAATGLTAIERAIENLSRRHDLHIEAYGHGLSERLTGLHETAPITEFRSGVSDRGASIRIPRSVSNEGHGYLEDRRPGANANPYLVAQRLIETVCEISLEPAPVS